ncbi:endonuclease [Maribacter sp. TH_r10]|uniref:endonuclease n=1 Tax=Maribacter sp. TH_r10 TaxID=3082086 RepID=UPI002955BE80|nr:endonuclease [Maribacter sp. TH_r10]MDV7137870.1 endonuclease [Maribacter sp. TH_r10]
MRESIFLISIFMLFIGCSSESSTVEQVEDELIVLKPIAVDDIISATEDQEIVLADLLLNDTIENSARITSFDSTSTEGATIIDNRDNTYTYVPIDGYVGEDTFTYTICDFEDPQNCSTAMVTINLEDEGTPIAEDDLYHTLENTSIVIEDALLNDSAIDNSTLFSIESLNTQGSIEINESGAILYTPENNFIGSDTFTYTICDDDLPEKSCSSATITVNVLESISFNIPTDLEYYYDDLAMSEDASISFEQLRNHVIDNHTTILSYSQRHMYLYNADADLNNQDNVILMYSSDSRYWEEYTSGTNSYSPQTFNTEHIYPQSLLSSEYAVTDLHHLRAADADVNSERLNYPFADSSGSYALINNNSWYPGDEWKGDVARMIFYLNVRYGETFNRVGTLELFLEWNIEDPVSDFELQRNAIIEGAQGNRNPFIDNPYLATLIWGGNAAENKWE